MSSSTGRVYILLTIILFVLSLAGVYLYIQNIKVVTQLSSSSPSVTPSPLPTLSPSPLEPTSEPTPASPSAATLEIPETEKEFSHSQDNFSVLYRSDRQVYQDKQSYGNRYTFYHTDGNFAIHVGRDWSWVYPNRQFSPDLIISGQPAFRYDIEAQTIVDTKLNDVFYTIQCIHSGNSVLKLECEDFLKNFKFL